MQYKVIVINYRDYLCTITIEPVIIFLKTVYIVYNYNIFQVPYLLSYIDRRFIFMIFGWIDFLSI